MTLYEYLKTTQECFDAYDTEYDIEVTVDWIEDETDFYDKFCMGIAKQVDFVRQISPCEIVCDWTKLIKGNISVFKEFTEKNWTRQYEDDEDEFIYQWIREIHYWIAGYASESIYKEFVENYLPRLT